MLDARQTNRDAGQPTRTPGGEPPQAGPPLERRLATFLDGLTELGERISESLRKPAVQQTLLRLVEVLSAAVDATERGRVLSESGWLPHESTPPALIVSGLEAPALSQALEAHYRSEWAGVRRQIEERVRSLGINDESKAAFVEALDAHDAGLYRCVVRVLMLELERVYRIDLKGGRSVKLVDVAPNLAERAAKLGLQRVIPGGYLGYMLFERLSEHLFAQARDKGEIARLGGDPVPNRHAVAHGLISYSSHKSSLNAIFMTDYVFQVIHAAAR